MLPDVIDYGIWQQVLDAESASQGSPDLGGAGLVSNPLPHQEDVVAVPEEGVRLVHGPVGLKVAAADAHQAEAAHQLLHVLLPPQARHAERVQEVSATQELQLGGF